jgi:hypothetical protein
VVSFGKIVFFGAAAVNWATGVSAERWAAQTKRYAMTDLTCFNFSNKKLPSYKSNIRKLNGRPKWAPNLSTVFLKHPLVNVFFIQIRLSGWMSGCNEKKKLRFSGPPSIMHDEVNIGDFIFWRYCAQNQILYLFPPALGVKTRAIQIKFFNTDCPYI